MIPIPTRQEITTTTAAMTIPAIAPEDRWEDCLGEWSILEGLESGEDESEAAGVVDGFDTVVVAGALWSVDRWVRDFGRLGIPIEGIVDEVLEMLLRGVTSRLLLEDVDEDSTALASAIETFAFALAKLVVQTLI